MAARRTRIKHLAVIPQRKKLGTEKNEENNEEEFKSNVPTPTPELNKPDSVPNVVEASSETERKTDNPVTVKSEVNHVPQKTAVDTNNTIKPPQIIRRRFVKPPVFLNLPARKPKIKAEEKSEGDKSIKILSICSFFANASSTNLKQETNTNLEETEIIQGVVKETDERTDQTKEANASEEKREDEQSKEEQILSKPELTRVGSDVEYPPAPPSPSKINRARIKAVPRFGQRRTSFSASESEDENKKLYGRIRNDSVCSTVSGVGDNPVISDVAPIKKDCTNAVQRKWKRTENSRKLTEARREFLEKFGSNKPDRHKLTMIDLVFYNPTNNPMSKKKKQVNTNTQEEVVEEAKENKPKSDEDEDLPAPQIKIGADGKIVLDEASLVIENKELKKDREKLQNSTLVDGDLDTGYGVYKRVKRSRGWTKTETLRFYKALNTIGTDFSLMMQLFPRRTRRELKMKFKKEERINRNLIDRALMQPINFDLSVLEEEVKTEERALKERERVLKEIEEEKKKRKEARIAKEINRKPRDYSIRTGPKRRKIHDESVDLNRGINSFLDDTDADDESDISSLKPDEEESSSDAESVIKIPVPQPTRSGRIPKIRQPDIEEKLLAPVRRQERKIKESLKKKRMGKNETSVEKPNSAVETRDPNSKNLEPGSIVVISSVNPEGAQVFQVLMVTPEQGKVTVPLTNDASANSLKSSIISESMKSAMIITAHRNQSEEILVEHNVTIPAGLMEEQPNLPNTDGDMVVEEAAKKNSEAVDKEHEYILPFDNDT